MKTRTIHSGLDGFQLLESLSEVTAGTICGTACLDPAPMFVFLEVMAQLAALHVRFLKDFNRHAFLLTVARCQVPEIGCVQGRFQMQAQLLSQSSAAFSYKAKAQGTGRKDLTAELLIGTQAYDDRFQKVHLQAHYQNLFNRLCNQKPETMNQKP